MDRKPRILIVDDEDSNLLVMEAMLVPLGYEVIIARDGMEALEKVRSIPPDVILLDIMMPKMDGFTVAKRLKGDETTKIIPVVMVTALSETEDRVRALEVGADDFLTKPVDVTELQARVASLLKVKAYNDHMRDYQKELEAEVAKRTEQLQQALKEVKARSLDTIYHLSRAAEHRDETTGAHIQRVSNYSAAIANNMDLDDEFIEAILYASPMHDVGKIGIPDHVLMKPGKLEPDEWEIMQQHTIIGAKILENSDTDFMKLSEIIALTHHEKWDGSGYPKGLRGAGIPLAGRIVAIADVFDALTTRRSYKEPFSTGKSFAIIKESRGSHFDPQMVDTFLAIKDEIRSISEKYQG